MRLARLHIVPDTLSVVDAPVPESEASQSIGPECGLSWRARYFGPGVSHGTGQWLVTRATAQGHEEEPLFLDRKSASPAVRSVYSILP